MNINDVITKSTKQPTQQERSANYMYKRAYEPELNFQQQNIFSKRFNDDFNKEFKQ